MSYSHDSDRSSRPRRGSIPIVRLACACQGRTLRVSTCDSSQRAGDGGLLTLRAGEASGQLLNHSDSLTRGAFHRLHLQHPRTVLELILRVQVGVVWSPGLPHLPKYLQPALPQSRSRSTRPGRSRAAHSFDAWDD